MKPISEWTIEDIKAVLDSKEQESLKLEFKASDAFSKSDGKKAEICKDLSALANSDGGLIIYGIKEVRRVDYGIEYAIDDGVDLGEFSIESFEQIIRSKISPALQNVKIHKILLETGRYLIIIDVEKSTNLAPHQSADKRYYKRHNAIVDAMHDYEIRDVMRRSSVPILNFDLKTESVFQNEGFLYFKLFAFVENFSDVPANYYTFRLWLQDNVSINDLGSFRSGGNASWTLLGESINTNFLFLNCSPVNTMPLFKEVQAGLDAVEIRTVYNPSPTALFVFNVMASLITPGFKKSKMARLTIVGAQIYIDQIDIEI